MARILDSIDSPDKLKLLTDEELSILARACNTHFVVVQDNNEWRLCLADIVERLECHTTSKRSIANKSHDLLTVTT